MRKTILLLEMGVTRDCNIFHWQRSREVSPLHLHEPQSQFLVLSAKQKCTDMSAFVQPACTQAFTTNEQKEEKKRRPTKKGN